MKRSSILSAGLAALALMVSACSQTSNPTASTTPTVNENSTQIPGQPGILARLQDPVLTADLGPTSTVRFIWAAGASGTSNAPAMIAARSIERVDFQVHDPSGLIIDTRTTNAIPTGVMRDNGVASITIVADTEWPMVTRIEEGSYVVAIVRGINGEELSMRATIPQPAGS